VANPTQERAPNAARFYAATDESEALAILQTEHAQFVIADWELPFRQTGSGAIMGRFQNVVDWAGGEHARYYQVMYKRDGSAWIPVWVFFEPYYRSMAYRLVVLGGEEVVPDNATSVLFVTDRADDLGMRFAEIMAQTTYVTYEAALEAARAAPPNMRVVIAGLDPWRPAFALPAIRSLTQVFESHTPEQKPGEAPWVRVFAVR
jgi:hypothetical protein